MFSSIGAYQGKAGRRSKFDFCARLMGLLAFIAAPLAQAGFQNGGFESDLANWSVTSYNWGAGHIIPTFPPTTEAHLGLTAPVADNGLTSVVGSGTDAQTGGVLGYPLYDNKAVRVNYLGNNYRVSAIDQTATMTLADVDPADGKVHVRFAIAPVLQNPGHPATQQPYFFVEVTNVTKGTQIFHTFNFSGQSGVPWVTVGGYQYTNWQAIDIAPGAGVLDVGDQVKVKIIGAGCGQSGHEGHVYVDSGPALTTLPGPYVYATGPQYTTAGGTVTYTYTYGNSGTSPLTNTLVTVVSPQDNTSPAQNLTFQSISGTGTGSCTTPGAGVAGTISCNFGTFNPNNVGTFQVTFNVPNPAIGPINHGNYQVSGDNSPAILGPLVQTNLSGATPLVDLGVTITDGQSSVTWGQNLTYTVVVSNAGPTAVPVGATIVETMPATLTGVTWTCAASAGTACPNASGSGAVNEMTTATIPMGDTLTYTVLATATGSGTSTINNAFTVSIPGGVFDSSSANNTSADVDNVGPALSTLTVNKSGAGTGTVSTVPGGINCGTACATANAQYPTGSQVALYASAPAGSIFSGWSGGGCSGTASSCTVTLAGATAVTADFTTPLTVTPVVGANGSVSPNVAQPVAPNGTTSFTVTPSAGYAPVITDNCAAGNAQTGGALVGNTYTTNAIAQNCNVNFNFTNVGVNTVTPSVGANGSITPNSAKTVLTGGSVSFTVVPNSGYATLVGGTCPAGTWSGSVYTISPVNADCSANFTFGLLTANNDIAPSGTRTVTPSSNDTTSGATIDPTTLDLDPGTTGIQTTRVTAQGTWTVIDTTTGTVNFAPASGFYGTASLIYAISNSSGFTSTATMSVPIDPSGVVYNSTSRLAVFGATVTLLYNGGSANAYVVGGNATQITNGAGQYAFFLIPTAPAGTYSLTVSNAGYTFVSTAIPAIYGDWPAAGGAITTIIGAPQISDDVTYHLSGPLPTSDVINNNIPLDPVAPVAPVAVVSIPTLSEYMMVVLTVLLLMFGFAAMRRHAM